MKKKAKGLSVSNFALLLVVFKWHLGSEGVKIIGERNLIIEIKQALPEAYSASAAAPVAPGKS